MVGLPWQRWGWHGGYGIDGLSAVADDDEMMVTMMEIGMVVGFGGGGDGSQWRRVVSGDWLDPDDEVVCGLGRDTRGKVFLP
ncbi:hypothetical protein Tco_0323753 [Tanacetum coccineum]